MTMVNDTEQQQEPTVSKSVWRESARASLKAFCRGPSDSRR